MNAPNLPSDEKLQIRTQRLMLEPVMPRHAVEMVSVLSDSELYTFVPQDAPKLTDLEKTYQFWSKRVSPDGAELWLNWVARLNSTGELIGHFQAGAKLGPDSNLGYTVGVKYQRHGYASEALQAILRFLNSEIGLKRVKVWIDTRNAASIRLVEKLGFFRIGFIENADQFKGTASDEFVYQFDFR